ncbi:MAG TPA: PAS domain S-box protein [Pyrinomonadaceae bacterium]|nr:PAS domain S-box protein [Pyrinomonadaceae bacterium]
MSEIKGKSADKSKKRSLIKESDDARFFLASILESLEDSVVSVDFNTIITSWNAGAERLYGYSAEEAVGKPLTLLTLPEDLQQILANIESIKQGETVTVYETERIHKDGHRIHLSITLSPVKNERGEIIGVSTVARDITDRRRVEQAWREARQRISDILENTTDCFFALDSERRFTYVNSQTSAYFGIPKEQMLGRLFTEVLPQITGHEILKRQDEAITERRSVHFETQSPVTGKWVEIHFYPTSEGLAVYFRDITARRQAEDALRKSEEHLRLALSISQISTFDIDLLTDEVKTDRIGREIYGFALDEPLTFTEVQSHFHPDDREYVTRAVAAALEPDGADGFEVEQRIVRTDGATRWIRVHGRAVFEGEGDTRRAVRCLGTYIDITGRKQAEEAVRAGKELYEIVAQATNDAIWDWNLTTNQVAWNEGVQTLFGYSPEQVSDAIEWWYEHIHPEDRDRVVKGIHEVIEAGGQEWSGEYRFSNADGTYADVLDRGFVIRDGAGNPVRMLGGMTDITERKRGEEILQRYRLLSEKARDIVWMLRPDGQVIEVNQAAVEAYGYSREELLRMNIRDLREPSTRERVTEDLQKASGGVHFETVHVRKDGSTFPVEVSANAADIGGEQMVMSIVRDITGRKRAEEALARLTEQSEQQRRLYQTILSTTPDLIYVFGLDHRFTYANQALLTMWGKSRDAAIGKNCLELGYEPWHAEMHDREIEQVIRTKQPIRGQVPFNGAFGRRIYDYIFTPVFGADGEVEAIAGTTRDVTESQIAQRNAEFLASVSEDLTELRTVDEIMRTVGAKIGEHLNLSLCAFVEISEAEDNVTVIYDWHREDVQSIVGVYNLKEYLSQDFQRVLRSGEVFVVRDVYSDPRADGEKYEALKIGSFVCVPLVRDGKWRFLLNIHDSKPRHWREDEIELARELATRIWTRLERARAEEERDRLLQSEQIAREEAERANRLKDEFLATISHELRTPLNAILGWSQILLSSNFGDPETVRRATETIERNARAQSQLIDDLLDISRIITGKLRLDVRRVDLPGVIMAAVEAARPAADAKNIRLETSLVDPQAATISGDPDRLQQIVWNLLSNAIKFTPETGRVELRLTRVGSRIEVAVADTGAGIEPEFLPFVFERFRQSDGSTTRRHGGLGLGLAIVRQLVELHGGTVSVTSAGAGRGAQFTVSLPLLAIQKESERNFPNARYANHNGSSSAATATSAAAADCPPELSGLRILLVDDEADSLDLLNFVLESCGAQVWTAGSANEALETVRTESFDLLISDIGMPEEDGYALIRRIRNLPREQGGSVPAIALTAYARAEDRIRALRSGFQLHIAKPVEAPELIASVANLAGRVRKSAESETGAEP